MLGWPGTGVAGGLGLGECSWGHGEDQCGDPVLPRRSSLIDQGQVCPLSGLPSPGASAVHLLGGSRNDRLSASSLKIVFLSTGERAHRRQFKQESQVHSGGSVAPTLTTRRPTETPRLGASRVDDRCRAGQAEPTGPSFRPLSSSRSRG